MRTKPEEHYDDVGPGWRPILERLVVKLRTLGWDEDVHQVKEKFGTLRFYIGQGTREIWDAIDDADRESMLTCEDCGAAGIIRRGGWLRTLCDFCNDVWKAP